MNEELKQWLERAEAERDSVALLLGCESDHVAMIDSITGLLYERDTLAAHVDRLLNRYVTHDCDCDKECGLGPCSCGLDKLLNEAPQTSLARLIARKQAEGGEYVANVIGGAHDRKLALMRVAELRRQAEEV